MAIKWTYLFILYFLLLLRCFVKRLHASGQFESTSSILTDTTPTQFELFLSTHFQPSLNTTETTSRLDLFDGLLMVEHQKDSDLNDVNDVNDGEDDDDHDDGDEEKSSQQNALLDKLSARQRRHVKKEILHLLGLNHAPKPPSGAASRKDNPASQYMLSLYRSLMNKDSLVDKKGFGESTGATGKMTAWGTERLLETADTIMTFMNTG